jgi:EAL domain-containing protein (putative c-di-GMP-specific phosphodiesterase class I)
MPDDINKTRQTAEAIRILTRTMDIDMVTDGIETESQLQMLRDVGCPYGQGHLFSKPLNPEDTDRLFTDPKR